MKKCFILFVLFFLTLLGCKDETGFIRLPSYNPNYCYGDVCDPETPGEEVCTINPEAPECLAYCAVYPLDPACFSTPTLDCSINPYDPACVIYCMEFPHDPMCGDPCELNPTSIECQTYCIAFPLDPDCSQLIDCFDTPEHIACQAYCILYPEDPVCISVVEPVILAATDIFTQNVRNNKVDVLWVIDNSGSMQDEQELLATNFNYFINELNNSNTDFQIGIVTTDVPDDNGLLQGNPKIIENQTMTNQQVVSAFMQNVQVGITGSSVERGLKSAKIALDWAGFQGSYNWGFLRNDAFLSIIIVSDEEDSSSEDLPIFYDFFHNIKGGIDFTNVYAIIDDQNYGCTGTPDSGNPYTFGGRYMQVALETGGFYRSICSTNFASSLRSISKGILKLINSFKLSHTPIQSTISVNVNGQPVLNDVSNGFIYDDSIKSIVFMGSYIPEEGSNITVNYNYYEITN